jgi:hypothetical protein
MHLGPLSAPRSPNAANFSRRGPKENREKEPTRLKAKKKGTSRQRKKPITRCIIFFRNDGHASGQVNITKARVAKRIRVISLALTSSTNSRDRYPRAISSPTHPPARPLDNYTL